MVFFRADGNLILGTGHVMRCLSFALALKEKGEEVRFITADDSLKQLIESRGFADLVLGTDYTDMESELDILDGLIREYHPDKIVVDSYYVTKQYLSNLNHKVSTAYIDDLMSFAYPVDVLINYNVYADENVYRDLYKQEMVKEPLMVLGPKYAPLRKEFSNVYDSRIRTIAEDVLILTGGSDSLHVAMGIADIIRRRNSKIRYHFVVGALSPDKEKLERISASCKNIIVHCNVTDMKRLMCSCDVAVSAAGSTQYELCACAIPVINYVLADNQIPGAEGFEQKGIMLYAGDVRTEKDFFGKICNMVDSLIKDYKKRLDLSKKAKALVDGNGAERLSEIFL